ncbi:hypothetical protein HAX54_042781 [Datura stramonium]|uniref:Uncharacterized protein n=1 Tax=Datura stramonium TaxID=4076 RepID=A0ABS8W1F0_DATST|nr:hypothetical protein [Datura stramonium]
MNRDIILGLISFEDGSNGLDNNRWCWFLVSIGFIVGTRSMGEILDGLILENGLILFWWRRLVIIEVGRDLGMRSCKGAGCSSVRALVSSFSKTVKAVFGAPAPSCNPKSNSRWRSAHLIGLFAYSYSPSHFASNGISNFGIPVELPLNSHSWSLAGWNAELIDFMGAPQDGAQDGIGLPLLGLPELRRQHYYYLCRSSDHLLQLKFCGDGHWKMGNNPHLSNPHDIGRRLVKFHHLQVAILENSTGFSPTDFSQYAT